MPGAAAAAPVCAAATPGSFVWTEPVDPIGACDELFLCARGPGRTLYACGGIGTNLPDTQAVATKIAR